MQGEFEEGAITNLAVHSRPQRAAPAFFCGPGTALENAFFALWSTDSCLLAATQENRCAGHRSPDCSQDCR